YVELLKRRSRSMLRLAKQLLFSGECDLAVLNAEYAARLLVKAILYRVAGEEVRGHSIRALIGLLVSVLEEKGFRKEAEELIEFVRRNRRVIAELEEGHVRSIYGVFSYSREQAGKLVEAADSIIGMLEKIEKEVFG
ncbi:MAG: HEPN domain-containing protein, partial [Thermofilaceae archaeon]